MIKLRSFFIQDMVFCIVTSDEWYQKSVLLDQPSQNHPTLSHAPCWDPYACGMILEITKCLISIIKPCNIVMYFQLI